MSTSIYRFTDTIGGALPTRVRSDWVYACQLTNRAPQIARTYLQRLHRDPALDLPRPSRVNAQRNYPAIYAESWSAEKVDEDLGMPEFDFSRGDVGEENVEIEGDCTAAGEDCGSGGAAVVGGPGDASGYDEEHEGAHTWRKVGESECRVAGVSVKSEKELYTDKNKESSETGGGLGVLAISFQYELRL